MNYSIVHYLNNISTYIWAYLLKSFFILKNIQYIKCIFTSEDCVEEWIINYPQGEKSPKSKNRTWIFFLTWRCFINWTKRDYPQKTLFASVQLINLSHSDFWWIWKIIYLTRKTALEIVKKKFSSTISTSEDYVEVD